MLLSRDDLQHINSVTHEGKVVVAATDDAGRVLYTVKQDGFEDSYLKQSPEKRNGWEDWKVLEFPDEAADQSVVEKEQATLTDEKTQQSLMRSRYKTKDQAISAPVQLVSGLGHLYVFRQSVDNTLLVDRFVLDGLTNTLTRKLEVRFKRSRQKHAPIKRQRQGGERLAVDALDFTDIEGKNFYEPTTELTVVSHLVDGHFCVVLLPTSEQDKYRWHIFAYSAQRKRIELTTLRASDAGLFTLQDYTLLDPRPRKISGIVKRILDCGEIVSMRGMSATRYDVQRERIEPSTEEESDEKVLLRDSVRVMLVVDGQQGDEEDEGAIALSFAAAADGTLSQILDAPSEQISRRRTLRPVLLPPTTLDEIKAVGTTYEAKKGKVVAFARGDRNEVMLTTRREADLDTAEVEQIKITGTEAYNRLYAGVNKVDQDTFEITPDEAEEFERGQWEVVPEAETGLIYNGIVTAYKITNRGRLRVTALNHGLEDGDSVQMLDTQDYNGTYRVTRINNRIFSLDDVVWQPGTAVSARLQSQKRRGITFDGKGDFIRLPPLAGLLSADFSADFTIETWVRLTDLAGDHPIFSADFADGESDIHDESDTSHRLCLTVRAGRLQVEMGEDEAAGVGEISLAENTWYHVAFCYRAASQMQTVFVDGVLDIETTLPGAGVALSEQESSESENSESAARKAALSRLIIGAASNRYLAGSLSELRIWQRSRTADEIKNSRYLSLSGKETDLLGYWRLDAIVEASERTVIDFALGGHDGVVIGDAYVGAVLLPRYLLGTSTAAIKYENEELFAVSERGSYVESFEFRLVGNSEDDAAVSWPFTMAYRGKKNRRTQAWTDIALESMDITKSDEDDWYRAKATFTVPDGISMLRSFGLSDINGDWRALEVRKHKIALVFNSISESRYHEPLPDLVRLDDAQADLKDQLAQLGDEEMAEGTLLKEKSRLLASISNLELSGDEKESAIAAKEAQISDQTKIIEGLLEQVRLAKERYQLEQGNPLNYWCKMICRHRQHHILRIYSKTKELLHGDTGTKGTYYSNNHFRFVEIGNGRHHIVSMYENRAVFAENATARAYGRDGSRNKKHEWTIEQEGDYYFIYYQDTNNVLDQGGGQYNVHVHPKHGRYNQQWKISRIGGVTSGNIAAASQALTQKQSALSTAKGRLAQLEEDRRLLNLDSRDKIARIESLRAHLVLVLERLSSVSAAVQNQNDSLVSDLLRRTQAPMLMADLSTDSNGLVTQGGRLGFVQSGGRLHALETCEGNVQLSYFDRMGTMQQLRFDATADSQNATFDQWIPEPIQTGLNFSEADSIATLNNTIYLAENWSIEAYFVYPLSDTANWNTLVSSENNTPLITVKKDKKANTDLLGIYRDGQFVSSGFDLKQLTANWYHLSVVNEGQGTDAKTTFYIDGIRVAPTEAAPSSVSSADGKSPTDSPPVERPLDDTVIDTASDAARSNSVRYIGNRRDDAQAFGKVSQISIWNTALSAQEVAMNSKTRPSGYEPDLVAYYPCDEAQGDELRDAAIADEYQTARLRATRWWVCAVPKAQTKLEHAVLQIKDPADAIDLPVSSSIVGNSFTVEAWVKFSELGGDHSILGTRETKTNQGLHLISRNSKLYLGFFANDTPAQTFLAENVWYHVAFCYSKERQEQTIYLNGVLDGKGENRPPYIGTGNLSIGKSLAGAYHFTGGLSELQIWDSVLPPERIQRHMHGRLRGDEPGLLAYYPLNHANSDMTPVVANTLPIRPVALMSTALVSCEYSTVDSSRTAMMRRSLMWPTAEGVQLLADKRIESLELKWIGNGQFAPTLLGYIEGAPPVPSENLTLDANYMGATSVELALSEDVSFSWTRSQDSGLGSSFNLFIGNDIETYAGASIFGVLGVGKVVDSQAGFRGNLDLSYQFQNESSITSSSSLTLTDTLQLVGTQETKAHFPHLGKRFIPKNVGYALVVSALADVFITRLRRSKTMTGYRVLPVENIPPDINTITFLLNPAYTMSGSLDGLTGSQATSQRFYKHVPEMRSQLGSLYPASYYRLQEAYSIKQQIEQQDKNRAAYFKQFDARLLDETSLNREINAGDSPGQIAVPGTGSTDALTEEEKAAQEKAKIDALQSSSGNQTNAVKDKQSEIDAVIQDRDTRANATESFANWQKKMEDLQIRAGKRNIVNTYVWDADGGLRAESQSFANTAEHSIGGAFSLNAALGYDFKTTVLGVKKDLTAQATVNLTQTMSKTEVRSKGIQLNVDLSGVESRGVTDYNDLPILPGEKVNRYRFMSFYLEGSTDNFNDFFRYVVDPEWLAGNSEEARALRQTKGKANKAWRVLHRVTYVERPALGGFGRDVRSLSSAQSTDELMFLQEKVDRLERQNKVLERKLDAILKKLD